MRRTLAALALLLPLATPAGAAEPVCPDVPVPPVSVPHLRAALEADQDAVVVALGSSTTQSHLASDRAHSYPAQLQEHLNDSLPFAHVAIINRGIGGQDVTEEMGRLDADALVVRPTMVIWQVGANGVLRHTDPGLFRQLLAAGVRRLQSANVDVILMDNQRAPAILGSPEHIKLEQALADVAVETGASLFSREHLMDAWQQAGYPYELFLSSDNLHHNDRGYACVARALSQAIVAGLGRMGEIPQVTAAR